MWWRERQHARVLPLASQRGMVPLVVFLQAHGLCVIPCAVEVCAGVYVVRRRTAAPPQRRYRTPVPVDAPRSTSYHDGSFPLCTEHTAAWPTTMTPNCPLTR